MRLRNETVLFGLVAVTGATLFVVAVIGPFEPIVTSGAETGASDFTPLRQLGGALLLAAAIGWVASKYGGGEHTF